MCFLLFPGVTGITTHTQVGFHTIIHLPILVLFVGNAGVADVRWAGDHHPVSRPSVYYVRICLSMGVVRWAPPLVWWRAVLLLKCAGIW